MLSIPPALLYILSKRQDVLELLANVLEPALFDGRPPCSHNSFKGEYLASGKPANLYISSTVGKGKR